MGTLGRTFHHRSRVFSIKCEKGERSLCTTVAQDAPGWRHAFPFSPTPSSKAPFSFLQIPQGCSRGKTNTDSSVSREILYLETRQTQGLKREEEEEGGNEGKKKALAAEEFLYREAFRRLENAERSVQLNSSPLGAAAVAAERRINCFLEL